MNAWDRISYDPKIDKEVLNVYVRAKSYSCEMTETDYDKEVERYMERNTTRVSPSMCPFCSEHSVYRIYFNEGGATGFSYNDSVCTDCKKAFYEDVPLSEWSFGGIWD